MSNSCSRHGRSESIISGRPTSAIVRLCAALGPAILPHISIKVVGPGLRKASLTGVTDKEGRGGVDTHMVLLPLDLFGLRLGGPGAVLLAGSGGDAAPLWGERGRGDGENRGITSQC